MRVLLPVIILLLHTASFAQIYKTNKNHRDNTCYLKINQDSTVIFIIENNNHNLYIESVGRIKHILDSTYSIATRVAFAQSIFENDRDEFSKFDVNVCKDFPYFEQINKLTLKYDDGKTATLQTRKGTFTTFYFDKKRFNKQHPLVDVYTNRRNPITNRLIYTKLFIRASMDFSIEGADSFKVIINKNTLKTIEEPPHESGWFILMKVL